MLRSTDLPRVVLALDIATLTGWAVGRLTDTVPRCGVWPLQPNNVTPGLGSKVALLENNLGLAIEQHGVELVFFAERFVGKSQGQIRTSFALDGAVEGECWRHSIRCVVQPEITVRQEIHGRQPRGTSWKALALAWCERQGIEAPDDNAAEACVMWRWARDNLVRRRLGLPKAA